MSERCVDRLRFLRRRVKDQREWIAKHGGSLAGYIRHYGDPGIAPTDDNGNAMTISCPDDLAAECGLRPVGPDASGCYYKEMFGSGGTLIYEADAGCLGRLEREWAEYEARYGHYLEAEDAPALHPAQREVGVTIEPNPQWGNGAWCRRAALAMQAAQKAMRAVSKAERDYSYELGLIHDALTGTPNDLMEPFRR